MDIRCAYNKLVLLSDLQPHPENENKHSDDQIRALADTMRKNKTSISWHIGSVYSLEHKASQLERERARLFASQKKNT